MTDIPDHVVELILIVGPVVRGHGRILCYVRRLLLQCVRGSNAWTGNFIRRRHEKSQMVGMTRL